MCDLVVELQSFAFHGILGMIIGGCYTVPSVDNHVCTTRMLPLSKRGAPQGVPRHTNGRFQGLAENGKARCTAGRCCGKPWMFQTSHCGIFDSSFPFSLFYWSAAPRTAIFGSSSSLSPATLPLDIFSSFLYLRALTRRFTCRVAAGARRTRLTAKLGPDSRQELCGDCVVAPEKISRLSHRQA